MFNWDRGSAAQQRQRIQVWWCIVAKTTFIISKVNLNIVRLMRRITVNLPAISFARSANCPRVHGARGRQQHCKRQFHTGIVSPLTPLLDDSDVKINLLQQL